MPAMARHVTFRSSRFETRTPAPHFINPDNFGEDVAGWLRSKLPAELEPGEVIQEDYGWGIWTRSGADPYWVAVGLMEADEGEEPGDWLVTIAYEAGFNLLRRIFHRPRPANLNAVCLVIDAALQGDSSITDIRWWDDQPFIGSGKAHPTDGGA